MDNAPVAAGTLRTGSLTISGGSTVTAGAIAIGQQAGDSTSVTIEDAGSRLNVSGALSIGSLGSGNVTVQNGADQTFGAVVLGASHSTAGGGSLFVGDAGSTLTINGTLTVGDSGSGAIGASRGAHMTVHGNLWAGVLTQGTGSLIVNDQGLLHVDGNVVLGGQGKSGSNKVLTGGRLEIGGSLTVGEQAGSSGALTVSGEGSTVDVSGHDVKVGDAGNATLRVDSGATLLTANIIIANQANSVSTFTIAPLPQSAILPPPVETTFTAGTISVGVEGRGRLNADGNVTAEKLLVAGVNSLASIDGTFKATQGVSVGGTNGTVNVHDFLEFGANFEVGREGRGTLGVFGTLESIAGSTGGELIIGENGAGFVRASGQNAHIKVQKVTITGGTEVDELVAASDGRIDVFEDIVMRGDGAELSTSSSGEIRVGIGSGLSQHQVANGEVFISKDGTIRGTGTISALGGLVLDGVLLAEDLNLPGNTLSVLDPVTGNGLAAIGADAVLRFSASVADNMRVQFVGNNARLSLLAPEDFDARIANFDDNDSILLVNTTLQGQPDIISPAIRQGVGDGGPLHYYDPVVIAVDNDGTALRFEFNGHYTNIAFSSSMEGANTVLRLTQGALHRPAKFFDFNNDGFGDVLFQHAGNGQALFAGMNNGAFGAWGVATGQLGDLEVGGAGDVNTDGYADVFVQDLSTGSIYVALQQGDNTPSWIVVSAGLTPEWKLRAVADVSGDTVADAIIQQESTGTIFFADVKADTFQSWGVVNSALTADWKVVGAGDLNKDGYADVVIQQQSTGTIFYADMAGGQFSGWGVVSGQLTPDWKAVAVGDVNGDGFADVILQNSVGGGGINPGTTYFADISNGTVQYGVVTADVTGDWTVAGVSDPDNDGFDDVVFQHAPDGATLYAEMGVSGFEDWGVVATNITADWHAV